MDYKDYYKTLGVERTATADEIKQAFRKLARKYHPDINKEPSAEARFKDVNEANEVLSDPEKRRAYDELGSNFAQGQNFRPPPNWGEAHEFRQHAGGARPQEQDFSDFFEELFGARMRGGAAGGQARQGQREFRARGEDAHARIVVSLRDSFTGATRQLSLRVPEISGDGRISQREKTLAVKIPKGITAGQVIRLKGQGGPGFGGEAAGDLYLEVAFAPDPLYRAEGKDLYLDLPVAPWEAALGASVQVPTPTGPIMLKVPPNSAPGRELRAKGRGLPAQAPGDLHVVLKIALPAGDTARAKELYEQMARDLAFDPRAGMEG